MIDKYADNIRKYSTGNIRVPDEIKVICGGKVYYGNLMPSSGDDGSLILKLSNGYNISIPFGSVKEIELVKRVKSSSKVQLKQKRALPNIVIIATGGTIASKVDYETGGVSPLSTPEELLLLNPKLSDIANVKLLQPFQVLSEDMEIENYKILGRIIEKEINKRNIKGVIVTHGTDTLHYTSAILSFMLGKVAKPIAVVGAQRSSDRGSADGVMNLLCAAHFCLGNIAEVCVVMHGSSSDEYCFVIRGARVRKMHTERRDAFRPINDIPLAKIFPDGKIEMISKDFNKRSEAKISLKGSLCDKVALLKSYPNSEPGIIDFLVKKGFRGFVIEGTGFGHIPVNSKKSWISSIKKAVSIGCVFVQTSQCLYGRTSLTVYSNSRILKNLGFISGGDMTPETAYCKLMWVMGQSKSYDKIKELMESNLVGELNDRSLFNTFLI